MYSIYVIDDEEYIGWLIKKAFSKKGYKVKSFLTGKEGIQEIEKETPDIVLLDIRLNDMDGIDVLKRIKDAEKSLPVIMITAHGTIEGAIEAMKLGAFFYLTKPFDIDELNMQVEKALEVERLKNEVDYLRLERDKDLLVLNNSPIMRSVYNTVQQVAAVSASVLITGESGTGKEVIANQIHRLSARGGCPFIAVNCGAINENLLESELFGHEKGAFTGAIGRKLGKFELANKGTIFLDEIGEMSMSMQVKLLRVLQEREITRVGGETNIKVDVRIISATNKNIMDEIKKGNFREDLYYRINVVPIELPPLRERREDIESYVKFFIDKFSQGRNIVISDEAMNLLKDYSFPGNIRELENIVERMVLLSTSDELQVSSLPKEVYRDNKKEDSIIYFPAEGIDLENVEKSLIIKSLEFSNYNQSKAAKLLNITRSALIYRMQKYEILGGKDEKEKD